MSVNHNHAVSVSFDLHGIQIDETFCDNCFEDLGIKAVVERVYGQSYGNNQTWDFSQYPLEQRFMLQLLAYPRTPLRDIVARMQGQVRDNTNAGLTLSHSHERPPERAEMEPERNPDLPSAPVQRAFTRPLFGAAKPRIFEVIFGLLGYPEPPAH